MERVHNSIVEAPSLTTKEGSYKVASEKIVISTRTAIEFYDITDQVQSIVDASGIKEGTVTVYTQHTTTALKINEAESGFFNDYKEMMGRLIPMDSYYKHNDFDVRAPETMCEVGEECANGHSHCQQMLTGSSSETVPLEEGKMMLGRWQRVFLVELDRPRERTVVVKVMGI